MAKDIIKAIEEQYDALSAGKKKVATYILNYTKTSSYMTLAELQKATKVSEATIIRFAYTVGFAGYTEMQNAIRAYVFDTESKTEPNTSSILAPMNQDITLIQDVAASLDEQAVNYAMQLIHDAQHVYIVGNNTSYGAAHWFGYVLGTYKSNVTVVTKQHMNKYLLDMQPNDVVVAISFPRYHKDTTAFIKNAVKQQARIISITDNQVSPIYKMADSVFFAKTNRDVSGYNEIAPIISLLNVIITQFRENYSDEVKERIQQLEQLNDENQDLVE
jgi:DNA-binding MurR/RpiR family transcriptional regulator